jgi:hypothetical protein
MVARLHRARKGSSYCMTSVESVDCKSLAPGSLVNVETRSRHYQIECLGGIAIRISGHPQFCPSPVPGQLEGSFDQEGPLERGRIECGMRLRFLLDDDFHVTELVNQARNARSLPPGMEAAEPENTIPHHGMC